MHQARQLGRELRLREACRQVVRHCRFAEQGQRQFGTLPVHVQLVRDRMQRMAPL